MNRNLLLLLTAVATVATTDAAEINASIEIRSGRVLPPPPPEIVVIQQTSRPGPPPWAPAHGARRKHEYYYYPGSDVYFRPEDRMWFYLDGREWRFGISLPASVRVDFNRAVPLSMETDRPYQFHNAVRMDYPADYFVTKVKVKEKTDKPGKADDRDGDSRGRGKAKGKNK